MVRRICSSTFLHFNFKRVSEKRMRSESNKVNFFRSVIPLIAFQTFEDEQTLVVSNKNIYFSLNVLKRHVAYHFQMLSCISGVDIAVIKSSAAASPTTSRTFFSAFRLALSASRAIARSARRSRSFRSARMRCVPRRSGPSPSMVLPERGCCR